MTYQGVKYDGKHEPLVERALFDQVGRMLTSRASGEKQRLHLHYLKSTVFCLECGERMIVHNPTNRHGTTYNYFICAGRHEKRTSCDLPAIHASAVEEYVEQVVDRVSLDERQVREIQDFLRDELTQHFEGNDEIERAQRQRITRLKAERTKLLQAHYAGAIPVELLAEEQDRIVRQLTDAERQLNASTVSAQHLEEAITTALAQVENIGERYKQASSEQRREINQSLFKQILIGRDHQVRAELHETLTLLIHPDVVDAARQRALETAGEVGQTLSTDAWTDTAAGYTVSADNTSATAFTWINATDETEAKARATNAKTPGNKMSEGVRQAYLVVLIGQLSNPAFLQLG